MTHPSFQVDHRYEPLIQYATRLLSLRTNPRAWIEEHLRLRTKDAADHPLHLQPGAVRLLRASHLA